MLWFCILRYATECPRTSWELLHKEHLILYFALWSYHDVILEMRTVHVIVQE